MQLDSLDSIAAILARIDIIAISNAEVSKHLKDIRDSVTVDGCISEELCNAMGDSVYSELLEEYATLRKILESNDLELSILSNQLQQCRNNK